MTGFLHLWLHEIIPVYNLIWSLLTRISISHLDKNGVTEICFMIRCLERTAHQKYELPNWGGAKSWFTMVQSEKKKKHLKPAKLPMKIHMEHKSRRFRRSCESCAFLNGCKWWFVGCMLIFHGVKVGFLNSKPLQLPTCSSLMRVPNSSLSRTWFPELIGAYRIFT